jgi:hypothetical protein
MRITKNRFLKQRVKVVEIKDLYSVNTSLDQVPFSLSNSTAVVDALKEISNLTNFNMIYKENDSSSKENALDDIFKNKFITFKGNNIANFLQLLSNNFNIFIDIDYDNKLIVFSKIKSKIYHVFVNNIQLSGQLQGEKSSSLGGNSSSLPITSSITLNILDDFETNLKDVSSNSKGTKLSFNKSSGQVYVRGDKFALDAVSKLIDDFNSIFNKQIEFELNIYEFAVTKDFDAGVSLGATLNNPRGKNVVITGQSPNLAASLVNMIYTRGTHKLTADVNMQNQIVRLLKVSNHGYALKNNIPYAIDLTDTKNYVKTVTVTTNATETGTVTTTEPQTDTISEGTVLTVLPRVTGKSIELNIEPTIMSINRIEERTYEGNTITLPDVSINKFKSNISIKSGERKIIGYITKYQDTKDYDGVVPIEDFIIGGESGREYVRTEIVFVVSANIKE